MTQCIFLDKNGNCTHDNAPYSRGKCYYVSASNCAKHRQAAAVASEAVEPPPKESLEKNVNHPKCYTKGKIECIDALESAVVGKTPEEAICVANVIKYLWRYEEKEPLRSLKSAEWYLKRLISKYEASNAHHD